MNSPITIDTQLLLSRFREAGYQVRFDPTDKVHRIYVVVGHGTRAHQVLVGLVVIRNCPTDMEPRVVYAEMMGRLYPWWGHDRNSTEYLQSASALVDQIDDEKLL
jgi:hypothetical protein